MRLGKEIVVLLVLLAGAVAFVLWYVIDRRAAMRAQPPPIATKAIGPVAADQPSVPLGGPNEGKTIDFSSGKPVVKDTPEDRAALEAGLREIEEATRNVTFSAEPKAKTEPNKP